MHLIFHIKTTSPTVNEEDIPRLHAYVGQLVNTTGCSILRVGGTNNHVHALVMMSPTVATAHLVEEMKRNSSRWIKTLSPAYEKFAWQAGYAAFSVSQSVVDKTLEYIANQAEHHKRHSFREEYLEFLRIYKVEYDERYVLSD